MIQGHFATLATRDADTLIVELRNCLQKDGLAGLQQLSNEWFSKADVTTQKPLNEEVFGTLMASAGLTLSSAERKALFDYFDTSGDGNISYSEFAIGLRGEMPGFAASLAFMHQFRGHYPSVMKASSTLPRFDSGETDDWLESLDAVLMHHGPGRARFLLQLLMDEAVRKGVNIAPSISTPMCNTIPPHLEPSYPGDLQLELKITNLVRWNAAVMVSDGNRRTKNAVGGHIGTFASIADCYEVLQHHCFRGKGFGGGMGDQVYLQGHAAPGAYARAYLEQRLGLESVMNFRQEAFNPGRSVSSYPHPRLMPDFWETPTVSMGLGPLQAVYQARFFRYLHLRGLCDTSASRIWCFIGDGEMDEPETINAIAVAGRERLNNLIMIVNCNYQRLDGPVRGNSKVIQEFEGVFRGAGFDCIKLVWGSAFNELVDNDHDGRLIEALERCPDGDCQRFSAKQDGSLLRKELFEANDLGDRVAHLTDEELLSAYITPGGHDKQKIYAAAKQAELNADSGGRPTVILLKTLKGFSLATFQGRNTVHQQKTMKVDEMIHLRDVLDIPLTDEQISNPQGGEFFRNPGPNSPEVKYMTAQREKLGGFIPKREPAKVSEIMELPPPDTYKLFDAGNPKDMSTTNAFAALLRKLMKSGDFGKRCVPMVTDEARTFGLNAFFHEFKIHAPFGQHYTPVDHDSLMKYAEAPDGQMLQEGITEAGALMSWIACGTSYATQGCPMLPFFIYYSMFGFQRVGDLIWQAADARARGFLLGATAGRTTLNGEGLQHQDGHSLLIALSNPAVVGWDPAFAYELAYIVEHGIQQMWGDDKDVIHYISLYNENYPQPSLPGEHCKEGILKGLYKFREAEGGKKHTIRLIGSGSIMRQVLKAADYLAEHDVACELWSATSFGEMHREGTAAERYARLHPLEEPPTFWAKQCLGDYDGITICATDNQVAYPSLIRPWVGGEYFVLGTDGFGRSDTREALRRFFEVDAEHITVTALSMLSRRGQLPPDAVVAAMEKFGISADRVDITAY